MLNSLALFHLHADASACSTRLSSTTSPAMGRSGIDVDVKSTRRGLHRNDCCKSRKIP